MTRRKGVLVAVLVAIANAYGCNAIFGIEDVTLGPDAGLDAMADGRGTDVTTDTGTAADTSVADAATEAAADTSVADAADSSLGDAGMEAAAMPCADAADFLSDPRNCGTCGHDCLGGACDAGQCQPFVLAAAKYASAIALGQGMIYLVDYNSSAVVAIPTDGGAIGAPYFVTALAAAVGGNSVYIGGPNGQVHTCAPNLTDCLSLSATGSSAVTAMTADDSGAYWGTAPGPSGSTVYDLASASDLMPVAAGLNAGDAGISGMAMDATYVYFVGGGTVWRIAKLADAGTAPDLLGFDFIELRSVVPLATGLYFTDQSGSVEVLPAPVVPYGPDSGLANTFAGGFPWAPVGLAADANLLYWANYTGDGGILACAPNPTGCVGAPKVIAAMPYTEWVAADDASVYFTTRVPDPGMLDDNNGALYQLVK